MEDIKTTPRKYLWFSALIILIIRIIPILFLQSINISTDEYTVISMAAKMAGYDWSSTMRPHLYYGYVLSVIYSFLFEFDFLINHPSMLFQAMLMCNAAIATLGYIFIYKTVNMLNCLCDVSNLQKTILSMSVSLLPTIFLYEKNATNETIYFFFSYVSIYLLVSLHYSNYHAVLKESLLAITAIMAYVCNGRGITIVAVIIIVEVWLLAKKSKKIQHFFAFFISLILIYYIQKYIKDIVVDIFFSEGASNLSEASYVSNILDSFISVKGWVIIFLNFICTNLAYILGTHGLGLLCLISIPELYTYYKKDTQLMLIIGCTLLLFLSNIYLTGLQFPAIYESLYTSIINGDAFAATSRIDKLFYDRYISVVYPYVILLLSLVIIKFETVQLRKFFYINLCLILLSIILYIEFILGRIDSTEAAIINSPIVSAFLLDFYNDAKFGIVKGQNIIWLLIYTIVINFVILIVIKWKKQATNGILLCISVIWILYLNVTQLIPRSDYYYNMVNHSIVEEIKKCLADGIDITFYSDSTCDYLYQMQMPNYSVKQTNIEELLTETDSNIMVLDYIQIQEAYDSIGLEYIIKEIGGENVFLAGYELINYYMH